MAEYFVDPVDGAHLTSAVRPSPPIHRYAPPADLTDLVMRYWIPVWSLPAPQRQSTLQHPVCLIVVSNTYARFYGPSRGLSSVTLEDSGWAVGTMLSPAAGRLLWQRPVTELVDEYVELAAVPGLRGGTLEQRIRDAMGPAPEQPAAHALAVAALGDELRPHLPVDDAGLLINEVVAHLRDHPETVRVADVAAVFGTGERALHRLVVDRVGLSPKWLIQRRRLHDAVHALKTGKGSLATLAADLGYSDQAHFTRDFKQVTGLTPGAYLAEQG